MESVSAGYRKRPVSPAFVCLIALLVLIGLTAVPISLGGDQALFLIGAERLAHGGVLYRDFWDLKQPGIYAWYTLAGATFGFSGVGMHLAELAYETTFAVVLSIALRSRGAFVAVCAPLFVVGLWYAAAEESALTQVEALVGFPLFLTAWTASRAAQANRPRLCLAAGIAGGVALAFKLLFAPIVVALLVAVLPGRRRRDALACAAWFACGLGIVVLPIVAYFVAHGAAAIAFRTTFVLPPLLVRTLPHQQVAVLAQTVHAYAIHWGLATVLAAYTAVDLVRSRARDPLAYALIAWAVVGVGVFFAQTLSWWPYQAALVATPVSLLAAFGLARAARGRTAFAVLAACVVFAPTVPHFAKRAVALVHAHGAFTAARRERFAEAVAPGWPLARYLATARALPPPPSSRDDLYVMGEPLIYVASGRLQPVAINGWSPTLLLPDQWTDLAASLAERRPRFIYLDRNSPEDVAAIERNGSALLAVLAREYRSLRRDEGGEVFEIVSGGLRRTCPNEKRRERMVGAPK